MTGRQRSSGSCSSDRLPRARSEFTRLGQVLAEQVVEPLPARLITPEQHVLLGARCQGTLKAEAGEVVLLANNPFQEVGALLRLGAPLVRRLGGDEVVLERDRCVRRGPREQLADDATA